MKKIPFLICWLTIGLMAHSQQIISLEDGSLSQDIVPTDPTRDVEEVSDGLIVKYVFKNALLLPDQLFENTYWWKVDGFGLSQKSSEPSVLSRIDQITIPKGKTANVEIVSCDYVDYEYALTPAREPLLINSDEHTKSTVQPITISDLWFPTKVIDAIDTQFYRGVGIFNVRVSPIQYNSLQEKVRAFKEITYKVTFSDAVSTQAKIKGEETVEHSISIDDPFLQNITINGYDSGEKRAAASTLLLASQGYLIISVPKYAEAVNAFAEWKRLLGFNVHIVMKDDWTSESVKSEVQSIYNSNSNLYYLLIIGDYEDVPSNKSSVLRMHYTDLYYTFLDNLDDYRPDIYCGRLPVSNEQEASIVVNKIIDYERNPITDPSFYNTGVHCAYFQDQNSINSTKNGYEDRRCVLTSEEVRDYLIKQGKSVQRIYYTEPDVTPTNWNYGSYSKGEQIPPELLKPTFAWEGNATDINNAINNGVFYALHHAHGGIDRWEQPLYTISDIDKLSNDNKLPIVFSINCLTGKFDEPVCFCEALLRKENGGCVAIIGASEESYSGENDILIGGMFDAIWPDPGLIVTLRRTDLSKLQPTPTPTYRLGQILNQGIERLLQLDHLNPLNSEYTREVFHCFGDPSMLFPTTVPTPFSDATCIREANKITIKNPNRFGLITIYDLKSRHVTCYRGTDVTYTTANPENVSVCISNHNKIPYISYGIEPTTTCIQNETISGPRMISNETIKIGSNVTDTKEQGPVVFDGGEVRISGSEIQIYPNTTITNTTTLKISTTYKTTTKTTK